MSQEIVPLLVPDSFSLLCSFLCFLNHRSYTINSFNQINPFLPWLNKHIRTHAHAPSVHTFTHIRTTPPIHTLTHPHTRTHTHSYFPLVSMPEDIQSRVFSLHLLPLLMDFRNFPRWRILVQQFSGRSTKRNLYLA